MNAIHDKQNAWFEGEPYTMFKVLIGEFPGMYFAPGHDCTDEQCNEYYNSLPEEDVT